MNKMHANIHAVILVVRNETNKIVYEIPELSQL